MKATTYNIITLFSLLTLFLVSTSCTDELATVPGPTSNGQTPRFIISTNSPQTRVSYGSITQSTFEEGDVLGAFVLDQDGNIVINSSANITYSNIQYRVVGNASDGTQTLEPVLSQDALPYGDGTYHYIFYYPFREGTVYDNVTHTVQTDQTTSRLYELSDLLWDVAHPSSTADTDAQPVVNVEMDHAMSNIVLEVPQEMMRTDNEGNVSGNAIMHNVRRIISNIQLNTEEPEYGSVTLSSNINMQHFGQRTLDGVAMEIYRLVLPPQTFSNGWEMFTIETPDGDKTYTAAFSEGNLKFASKTYYIFTVTESGLKFRAMIKDLTNEGNYYYEY